MQTITLDLESYKQMHRTIAKLTSALHQVDAINDARGLNYNFEISEIIKAALGSKS